MFTIPILDMFGFLFAPKFLSCETSPTEQVNKRSSVKRMQGLRRVNEGSIFATFQASIFSVFLTTWSIATLFVGPLAELRSDRFVAIFGNVILILGLLLSAFATTTLHLVVSIGLLIGPAFGLINVNVLLTVNTWFHKKAGLAISVMLTINCLGKMAVPQLVKLLLLKFTVEQVGFERL